MPPLRSFSLGASFKLGSDINSKDGCNSDFNSEFKSNVELPPQYNERTSKGNVRRQNIRKAK